MSETAWHLERAVSWSSPCLTLALLFAGLPMFLAGWPTPPRLGPKEFQPSDAWLVLLGVGVTGAGVGLGWRLSGGVPWVTFLGGWVGFYVGFVAYFGLRSWLWRRGRAGVASD